MFGDGVLTFREFAMKEPLPLAKIHETILEFLRHRNDAMLFGAHAVNAYVDEPRMTQDVDVMSPRAAELAEEIRALLAKEFTIAARVREVAAGHGFRVYQLRQPKNRHLVDVRQVVDLPPNQLIADVRVPIPEELIAQKVISYSARRGQPKSGTDWRDLTLLLLAHPDLKTESGPVLDRLAANSADEATIDEWKKLVALRITPADDSDDWDT
jgi:hypothetical protein